MFRRIAVATVVLSLMALAAPAIAGKPELTATITLEMDGAATASAAEAGSAERYGVFGETVSFSHRITGKTAKNSYMTIRLYCEQDGVRVYDWYGQTDFDFPLMDQLVNGTWWDGGEADCTAYLRYFAHNKMSIIADTSFQAFPAG